MKHGTDSAPWRFYVYQFFNLEACIYVGKGSGARFANQCRRFKGYDGRIIAYFRDEQSALDHERALILELAPAFNKALMPAEAKPWLKAILPEKEGDFSSWCEVLGTKQMAARVLLSKDWFELKRYGVDIKRVLSKLDPWCEAFNGLR
jgi:hypothetical protein